MQPTAFQRKKLVSALVVTKHGLCFTFIYSVVQWISDLSVDCVCELATLRARFTKQGKLAREHNSKTALMGVEISAGNLLTTCKLKNTDAN